MIDKSHINCDLLVIGSGLSGMAASAWASKLGLNTVQAGSSAGFYLVSGLMDFLGVYPIEPLTRLKSPKEGLPQLKKEIPCHPYSKVSDEKIIKVFDFVNEILNSSGLEYISRENKNFQILTAAGTFKPSFLVPGTMVKSSNLFEEKRELLLVDFNGLKGFSAKQIARKLEKQGHRVETLSIEVPQLTGDFNVSRLARQFEDADFLNDILKQVQSVEQAYDLIGLPAVCGINNSSEIVKTIETQTGKDCFEIPGLPPSIPGLRLKNTFEKQLSQNNVTVLNNSVIKFKAFQNNQIVLDAISQNFNIQIKAKGVILATGRFPGGGLEARRGQIQETVFNIPVDQPEKRSLWYDVNLFHPEGHGINQAGIQTDSDFRPLNNKKRPLFDTLYAAGSILAHNDWVRLKSGAGVSCVSACCAVDHFYTGIGGGYV